MAEIIDLKTKRQERAKPEQSYFVRVDMYPDGIAGAVLEMGDEVDAETKRIVANHLNTLARWLRDMAFQEDGNENEQQIAEAHVFASSRVWTHCDKDVQSEAQLEWLDERFDDAKDAVRLPLKS